MKKKKLTKKSQTIVYSWFISFIFLFLVFTLWLVITLSPIDWNTMFHYNNDFLVHNIDNKYDVEERNKEENELTEEAGKKGKISRVSLVMVGDALFHSAVYADGQVENGYDFRSMLSFMKPIISNYDLAFYNQESILGGTDIGLSSYPRFNSPYEVGDAFLDTGFNMVSLANNHTLDRGEEAILNSVSYWNSKGVMFHGSSSSFEERSKIRVMEKNGIRYALLSYTDYTNDILVPAGKDYLVNVYDEEQVRKDIYALRGQTDVIMVAMHFGEEYSLDVTDRQREIASYLASLGVHIVIGHHPHVVETTEMIGNTLVIYSLGNFISAQRGIETLTGLIYSVDIVKEEKEGEVKVYLENQKASLTYTYSEMVGDVRKNFKVYPYRQLNEKLLPNYEIYYNRFMNVVVANRQDVEKW